MTTNLAKRSSFNFNPNEQVLINHITTSTFEKTISILKNVKEILKDLKVYESEIEDIDWVVQNIKQRTLFDLDIGEDLAFNRNNSHDISEMINLLKNHTQSFNENLEMSSRINRRHTTVNHLSKNAPPNISKKKDSLFGEDRQKVFVTVSKKKRSNTTFDKDAVKKVRFEGDNDFEEDLLGEESENILDTKKYESTVTIESIIEDNDDKNDEKDEAKFEGKDNDNNRIGNNEGKGEEKIDLNDNNPNLIEIINSSKPKIPGIIEGLDKEILYNTKTSSMDFDIFDVSQKLGRENALTYVFQDIVKHLVADDKNTTLIIKEDTLKNFSNAVKVGYIKENPYHNDLHGADVLQTAYSWMEATKVGDQIDIEPYDDLAFLTACLIHDFRHPGVNNNYMVNTLAETAIIYNDKSVLENMHIAEAFKILLKPNCNLFENFSMVEFKIIRRRMIETVLHTDMAMHFNVLSLMKGKVYYLENDSDDDDNKSSQDKNKGKDGKRQLVSPDSKNVFDDQQEILNFLIHSADISANTKCWDISLKWGDLVYEEFFLQGDLEREKGLPFSMFCDRKTTNVPKAQIGFIVGIILPNFELLIKMFPELAILKKNVENNRDNWEEKFEALEKLNNKFI